MRVTAGNPVTGKDFIGRDGEIRRISQYIKLGQSIVIIAPRRFGKTSMVLEILRRMKSGNEYTAYVDVFSSPTLELLSSQIIEAVLKNHKLDRIFMKSRNSALAMMNNLKLKTVIEDFEFILGFTEKKKNDWGLLKDSISFIDKFSERHHKKMICAFDEFGDINKLDGKELVKLIRSGIQQHKNAAYIFSGSYESIMSGMFIEKNSPFYRFARIFHLKQIEEAVFAQYYDKVLSKYGIPYSQDYIEEIIRFTEGHPYYSQLALQEIIVEHLLNGELHKVTTLQAQMLNTEKNYLEKAWEDISSSKERVRVLLALVKSESGIYSSLSDAGINVSRGLNDLTNQGILFREPDSKYRISDPILKLWIRKNILRDYN